MDLVIPDQRGGAWLELRGRVTNHRAIADVPPRYRSGVAFDEMPAEKLAQLEGLLRSLLQA
jgi:hypothetical protein